MNDTGKDARPGEKVVLWKKPNGKRQRWAPVGEFENSQAATDAMSGSGSFYTAPPGKDPNRASSGRNP
jgi:hypothetical protein